MQNGGLIGQNFDSRLRIEHFEVFPIFYKEAMHLQCQVYAHMIYVSEHSQVHIYMWLPLPDLPNIESLFASLANQTCSV